MESEVVNNRAATDGSVVSRVSSTHAWLRPVQDDLAWSVTSPDCLTVSQSHTQTTRFMHKQ